MKYWEKWSFVSRSLVISCMFLSYTIYPTIVSKASWFVFWNNFFKFNLGNSAGTIGQKGWNEQPGSYEHATGYVLI